MAGSAWDGQRGAQQCWLVPIVQHTILGLSSAHYSHVWPLLDFAATENTAPTFLCAVFKAEQGAHLLDSKNALRLHRGMLRTCCAQRICAEELICVPGFWRAVTSFRGVGQKSWRNGQKGRKAVVCCTGAEQGRWQVPLKTELLISSWLFLRYFPLHCISASAPSLILPKHPLWRRVRVTHGWIKVSFD